MSELVRPVRSSSEFEQLSGIDIHTFRRATIYAKNHNGDVSLFGDNDFLQAAGKLIFDSQLLSGDFGALGHWGKTNDGRLVSLDYGGTSKLFEPTT